MSVRIALRSVVCLLALFLFSTAAFGSFPIRSRNIGGTTHVVLYDVIRYYGLKSHVSGRRITLYGAETEIIGTVDIVGRAVATRRGIGCDEDQAKFRT